MSLQIDGGAVIGRERPATNGDAALGCLGSIAIIAIIIYLLFFSDGESSLNLVEPVEEAKHIGSFDFNEYFSGIYGYGNELAEKEPVVIIQNGSAEIAADDRLYLQGEAIRLDVSTGKDSSMGGIKHLIRQVRLVSPEVSELYSNPDAGFGDVETFTKDIRSNVSIYSEKDTVSVEIPLDDGITGGGAEKASVEFEISYVYAYAHIIDDRFSVGSETRTVKADLYKKEIDGQTGYILRDPDRPKLAWALENDDHSWTVQINLENTEAWDKLVYWSPVHMTDTDTLLYAGVKDGRYDYVIARGTERKTSFEGPGFSAFGSEKPVFGKDGKALFCAQRGDQWCMIHDGTEFPFHDDIGASSIAILDDGRFLYAAADDGLWSIFIASPQGTEFPIYTQMYGIKDQGNDPPVSCSPDGKLAFTAVQSEDPKIVYAVHSKQKAAGLNEKSVKENIVADQAYSDINDFWWSPEGELIYIGEKADSEQFSIIINGTEYTYDQAQEYLLAQCTGDLANKKDEVINYLHSFQSL